MAVVGMNRVNPNKKICNSCRLALARSEYYEGKQTCRVCSRAKELKQLGRRLNIQPYLDNWRRF